MPRSLPCAFVCLLAHGARADIPDAAGRTASDLATISGNPEMQMLFAMSRGKSKGK
ncbi:MAG: hypothetical protein JXL80_13630 [Planctomycetes bacterium]|nr:hypothetical protein [Planctomycetota bacterium]